MANFAFFGTPDFAVPTLEALAAYCEKTGDRIVLVVCQPDQKKGRGQKMQHPPVKACALELGLKVVQPPTLKKGTPSGDEFFELYSDLDLDLAVVAAYGRILATRIFRTPKMGSVNIHGSLLPRWRGAAPIQRAIEAGDAKTGICLMDMVFELDAGDVYAKAEVPIAEDETTPTLSKKLSDLGGELFLENVGQILDGSLQATPQSADGLLYASMLRREESEVDWSRSAKEIANASRAFQPWPGTTTTLAGAKIKLRGARVVRDADSAIPGTILQADIDGCVVQTGSGQVSFQELQFPGKPFQNALDSLNGRKISIGDVFKTAAKTDT